jgi:hypothetical protein
MSGGNQRTRAARTHTSRTSEQRTSQQAHLRSAGPGRAAGRGADRQDRRRIATCKNRAREQARSGYSCHGYPPNGQERYEIGKGPSAAV